MLRNYLKIVLRTLWKQKGYTTLNVGGLAVGMATCLLIGLYIQDELYYDDFHPRADQIQMMMVGDSTDQQPSTPYPLGRILSNEVPGVKHVTQTKREGEQWPVRYEAEGRRIQRTQHVLKADSSFFRVFTGFPLYRGTRGSVLDAPGEAVITESMAETFFGNGDPIGRTLAVEEDTVHRYTVVGVTSVPANSTVQFDMVTAWTPVSSTLKTSWHDWPARTYARIKEGISSQQLGRAATQAAPLEETSHLSTLSAMSLPDYYLSDEYETGSFRGQVRYLYIFGSVALLVLLIAMVNYVNLVTAQAQQRVREVGVRKAMGARRAQVTRQFLTETLLLSGLALVVAIVLVSGSIPTFNTLFDKSLSLARAQHGWALLGGAGIVLAVTLLGGAYPALVLSGLRPTRILRGASITTTGSGGWLRKGLVVLQFTVSAGLILGTTVIYQQLDYVQTKHLGFDGEQVVTVILDELDADQRQLVRRRVRRSSHVMNATVSSLTPGSRARMVYPRTTQELSPQVKTSGDKVLVHPVQVDTNYVETLGLNVVAGRTFASSAQVERGRGYILNQAAVKEMGWTEDEAVGNSFRLTQNSDGPPGKVIGVVENFHLASLRSPISPVVLAPELEFTPPESVLAARLAPNGISGGMEHLREVMSTVAPQVQFSYEFLDEKFDAMYRSEERLALIFATFAIIALIVACMGLFGLAAFAAQRRTREIGVRKALGASVTHIVGLLSKEYAVLVTVALVIGLPAAYVWIQQWLNEFAYRVDVGAGTFVVTAGLVLGVAGLAVSSHAIRAARTDPAQTLRDE